MFFSDYLWQTTEKTYGLTPEALVDAAFDYLTLAVGLSPETVRESLLQDYLSSGARSRPKCLAHERLPLGGHSSTHDATESLVSASHKLRGRQDRHVISTESPD
jgi:hypothetical protein